MASSVVASYRNPYCVIVPLGDARTRPLHRGRFQRPWLCTPRPQLHDLAPCCWCGGSLQHVRPVVCKSHPDTGLGSVDSSTLAARIADNYEALQHPALRNLLYSQAVKDFAQSAILAYECGWTEESLLAQLQDTSSTALQEVDYADCMRCLMLVWITLLSTPRNSVMRWSTGAPVSQETMSVWGGFVKMITSAYFEKRWAWYPIGRLQLEVRLHHGRGEEPSLVAE